MSDAIIFGPHFTCRKGVVESILFQSDLGERQGSSTYFLRSNGTYDETHIFGDFQGSTNSSRERIEELERHVGGISITRVLGSTEDDVKSYLANLRSSSCCGEGDCHHCCR